MSVLAGTCTQANSSCHRHHPDVIFIPLDQSEQLVFTTIVRHCIQVNCMEGCRADKEHHSMAFDRAHTDTESTSRRGWLV